MADQWEMCVVNNWFVLIYSPGKQMLRMSNKEYLKSVGEKGDANESIIHLLGEGWEPYAVYGEVWYFRRKYQG